MELIYHNSSEGKLAKIIECSNTLLPPVEHKPNCASWHDSKGKLKHGSNVKKNTLSALITNKQTNTKAKHLGIPGNENQPNLLFI